MAVVRILYFAGLRDRIGVSLERMEFLGEQTETSILHELCSLHPEAVELLMRSRVACDDEFVHGEITLHADAELAVIPPVSGG